ncbi:hypothetical protein GMLC_14110 [Geomonas limicola]|uniref:Uncharacterized protein n=1 Tax=Geomonas limicola TaxID=2740186 RepID=A0A6V8N5J4_9BACT|nr:hypothetical protein [Geomonas limicola]GFO67832.1 hypothetical protein GMLC_14110 [Geomonas limicola]
MPHNKDPFERSYHDQGVNDLIFSVNHFAEKAEGHVAFQGPLSEYVSPSTRLREYAVNLENARNSGNNAELDRLVPQVVQALDFNADHVVRVSEYRNDASILHNAGYDFKTQHSIKVKVNLLDLVPELSLKHLENVSGGYTIVVKKAKNGAVVELQCTETPDVEDSWKGIGDGTFNKSRAEIRGGEPTKRIYVRGRYHEDGRAGRWCTPVNIILL